MKDLTEKQRRCVEAYEKNNYSDTAAAEEQGISVSSLRKNLWFAIKKGWHYPANTFLEEAPVGFEMTHGTMHIKDGQVVQSWPRISKAESTAQDFARYLAQRTPTNSFEAPRVRTNNTNLMLEWPIYDAHHGMLAWAKETGSDYDHKISRHLQICAGKIIAQSFGKVKRVVVLIGGDNQTADNRQGKTEKSGNILDTDSRYPKMAWATHEANVASIETACSMAEEVKVIVLPGNHDPDASTHLIIQLNAYFRNVSKVEVDISPAPHKFYRWGTNVFMGSHGQAPEKRLATYMLNQIIERGLAKDCKRKLVRIGHLHQRGSKTPDPLIEADGVLIERFPTLAAQEAYSIEGAYSSCRATSASLWDKRYGKFGGREITVAEILDKYPIK